MKENFLWKTAISAGCFLGGCIIAFGRFLNQSHSYRFGGDFNAADLTVHEGPNALDVWTEHALGAAGDLSSDAAEVLGFAPPGDTPAATGLLASKKTGPCHPGRLPLTPWGAERETNKFRNRQGFCKALGVFFWPFGRCEKAAQDFAMFLSDKRLG